MGFITGVQCDKCGKRMFWNVVWAKKYLVKFSREKGWSIGKEKIHCPECKNEKKENTNHE